MVQKAILFCLLLLVPALTFAQQTQQTPNPSESCNDPYLHSEMVEQNEDFLQQGFSIDFFKVIQFPKNTYVPVKVHLEQGKMYQINFVANRFFQNFSMVMMGKDKQQIFSEKVKGKDSQQHWFSKSMAAPYTGDYWIIMSQKAKGRDMVCGGLSVLKAGGN